jgi:hypothetical protein
MLQPEMKLNAVAGAETDVLTFVSLTATVCLYARQDTHIHTYTYTSYMCYARNSKFKDFSRSRF